MGWKPSKIYQKIRRMKRLIIADLKSFNNQGIQTGHYFSLAKNYQELFKEEFEVKIAGGPIYNTGFENHERLSLPYDWGHGGNRIKNVWCFLRNAKVLFSKTTQYDIIVMQMASSVTTFLAIAIFASKHHKIYSIQYDTEALDSPLKKLIYQFAKHKISGIICPAEQIGKHYNQPYCVVSDYIYTGNKAFNIIPFNEKKYDFCIVGRIVPEKGVVEAVERLANSSYRVLVAGKPSSEAIENRLFEIAHSHPNIELHLGFVSDEDFYNYLKLSKYSLMNYQGVYTNRSSGVVLDALFNGTPVLGHRCLAMQFVEDNAVGKLYDDISTVDLSIVEDETIWENQIKSIKKYLKTHQVYKNRLIEFIHN